MNEGTGTPTVSVIIPVYNGECFLRECLDSALAQSLTPLDVVVVNDGSTDGTAGILREYSDRVTTLEQENRGQAFAVNRAAANSTGDFIAFLDCDDCWDRRKLERQVATFERFPDAVAVYCDHRRIDASGTITGPSGALAYPRGSGQVLRSLIHGNFIATPSTAMVRAHSFRAVGGFDEADPALGSKDYGFWLRLATQGSFVYLAETLASYRHHSNNLSSRIGSRRILSDLAALRGLAAFQERFPDAKTKIDYRNVLYETTLGAAWCCSKEGDRAESLRYYSDALRMKPWRLLVLLKALRALVTPGPATTGSVRADG